MPKGGRRPGAGRPKGTTGIPQQSTIDKALHREVMRAVIVQHMPAMLEAQIKHAQGLKYLVSRDKKTGKFTKLSAEAAEALLNGEDSDQSTIEVWDKDPSVQAFTDLMNRALDKPIEQQETHHTGTLLIKCELPD